MRKFNVVLTCLLVILNGGAVLAQNSIPSPSEQEVRELNRSIQGKEQTTQWKQQDQSQDQKILNQEDRNLRDFPAGGNVSGGCPSGSVDCWQERHAITPAFRELIPNIPGKSLVALVVNYQPGGASPAHYHPRSAFVTGYVLSGSIRSQVNDSATRVFHAGEHWTEPPDAYHAISENASDTESASLLAIFVVDTTDVEKLVTSERQ